MNKFQKKSENSFQSGDLLKKAAQYDNCIHCYYYACVQLMTLVREKDVVVKRNFTQNRALGVHQQLITSIAPDLSVKSIVDFLQFNNEIQLLKRLRSKGDYEEKNISSSEAEEAALYSENLLNLLKKNYLT
ncbi:MAG: hypothetical protein AB8G86_25300 [Saprospiraceae bacterium]